MDPRIHSFATQLSSAIWGFAIAIAIGCAAGLVLAHMVGRTRRQRRGIFGVVGFLGVLAGAAISLARVNAIKV